jgi:2C-methyl-D-erythritol 2,4-cyclodiphosphate synthase
VFIREAMRLMHERGYKLGNLDATIIAEARILPHVSARAVQQLELLGLGAVLICVAGVSVYCCELLGTCHAWRSGAPNTP